MHTKILFQALVLTVVSLVGWGVAAQPDSKGKDAGAQTEAPKKSVDPEILTLIRQASLLQTQKKYPEAEKVLGELLKKKPDYEEGILLLSVVYEQTKRKAEAIKIIQEGLAKHPKEYLKSYYRLAALHYQDRNAKEAIKVLDDAITNIPTQASLYVQRAQYKKADVVGAEQDYKGALKIDPNHRAALNNLAILYTDQNRYTEAKGLLEIYHKNVKGGGVSGRFNLASTYYTLGLVEEGIAVYQELLKTRTGDPFAIAHVSLGHTLLGRGKEARAVLGPEPDPAKNDHIAYALGMAELFEDKLPQAAPILKDNYAKSRGRSWVVVAYAETLRQLKRLPEAEKILLDHEKIGSEVFSLTKPYLALVRHDQGRVAEGQKLLKESLAKQPDYKNPDQLKFMLRFPDKAVATAKVLLSDKPTTKEPATAPKSVDAPKSGCGCAMAAPRSLSGSVLLLLVMAGGIAMVRRR